MIRQRVPENVPRLFLKSDPWYTLSEIDSCISTFPVSRMKQSMRYGIFTGHVCSCGMGRNRGNHASSLRKSRLLRAKKERLLSAGTADIR